MDANRFGRITLLEDAQVVAPAGLTCVTAWVAVPAGYPPSWFCVAVGEVVGAGLLGFQLETTEDTASVAPVGRSLQARVGASAVAIDSKLGPQVRLRLDFWVARAAGVSAFLEPRAQD